MPSDFSHVRLFATPWTVAHQAPLSMGVSRQEYWSGLPHPSPGDLPDPEIEPKSLTSPALAGGFFTIEPPGNPNTNDREGFSVLLSLFFQEGGWQTIQCGSSFINLSELSSYH